MIRFAYLGLLLFMGCASSTDPKPIAVKPEPLYVRHLATKSDLLYTYRIHGDGATGYELAEADAAKYCRSKFGLDVGQKTQPSCGVYNTSQMHCAVTFTCR